MRIAIIGGGGFLGSQLYASLQQKSTHSVKVLDIQFPDSIALGDRVFFDVSKQPYDTGLFETFDLVYYKIGLMGPSASFDQPLLYYKLNLEGALRVLDACIKAGVAQFAFDSTESVFGITNSAPFNETDQAEPSSVYGALKVNAEQYIKYAAAEKKINAVIFRYPRIFGSSQQNLIGNLAQKIHQQETITLSSMGEKVFDIVHVEDVTRWNEWVVENMTSTTLHVASEVCLSAHDLVKALSKRITGDPSYQHLKLVEPATLNDQLLPQICQLSTAQSLNETGLNIRYKTLDDFFMAMKI